MEDDLGVARSHAARAIAAERWLKRELTAQHTGIEHWHAKARAALTANREDLARLALTRKRELEIAATDLATQHAAVLDTCTHVRATLRALEANLDTARSTQRSLIARHRAAQARRALGHAVGKQLGSRFTLGAKLQHWEQRLTDVEDVLAAEMEVQSVDGPEANFAAWEAEQEIERDLAALKEETSRK
jgi:phage shock protein A